MLITVGISLYTTRLILDALGAEDYGIYNLVAGVIAMLSFLNGAMATSTQRFLSYNLGTKNINLQKKTFGGSLLFHSIIGLIIVLILTVSSTFLFEGFLNIALEKIESAKIIFHLMTITVFFTIITVPFTGSLLAHENMLWGALVNILESILKLICALLLSGMAGNKLVTYGLFSAAISAISFTFISIYCSKKYEECSLKNLRLIDRQLIKKLSSFAGWNLFGALCGVSRSQGLAILLNIFYGTTINAAYAISNQVSSQLNFFSVTMLGALNPQIMKSEGAQDRNRMLRLSMVASKFGFFLLSIFAIPFIFEMEYILNFWLQTPPKYSVIFCQLALISMMVNQLTIGLQSAIQATGKIKLYQTIVGSTLLLNIPIAYLILRNDLPPYLVLGSYIFIEFLACIFRLFLLNKISGLSIYDYFQEVIFKQIPPAFNTFLTCFIVTYYCNINFRFLITIPISILVFSLSVYYWGLNINEKKLITNLIQSIRNKFTTITKQNEK
mgnify:CR=1 FL=1